MLSRCLVTLAVVLTVLTRPAAAQCSSNASSCTTCHQAQNARSALHNAQPWHVDHAFGDLCASCHAGNPAVMTKERAHVGLRSPLAEPEISCASCHADDAAQRAESYAAVSPSPSAPASNTPASPSAASPSAAAPAGSPTANRILVLLIGLLTLALGLVVRRRPAPAGRSPLACLRRKTWSPYAAGALLGLVVAFSETFLGRPLAASGAFDRLAAYPGVWLFPSSQYFGHIMIPMLTWQVWLVFGCLLGSFASSKLSGQAHWRWLPDTQWQPRFGASRQRRLVIAFFGALLVQLGADIAGGCTSGLAISGGAALTPAAFLFIAGMFAGGIPAAWHWYHGRVE